MFANCESLKELDLSSFNGENLNDVKGMFQNCKNITTIKFSDFNGQNITKMNYMFDNRLSNV